MANELQREKDISWKEPLESELIADYATLTTQFDVIKGEYDAIKTAYSTLQLENQTLREQVNNMAQALQGAEKKRSKFKKFEDIEAKLEQKKAELSNTKAIHAQELASLREKLDVMQEKVLSQTTEDIKHQFILTQVATNLECAKEELEQVKESERKLKKKYKNAKEKNAQEKSNLKVQIELLKQEIAEVRTTVNSDEKSEKRKEKDWKRNEVSDKALKSLQQKNSELISELGIVREEIASVDAENMQLKREITIIIADNEKLLEDNAELMNQLQRLHEDVQGLPNQSRYIELIQSKQESIVRLHKANQLCISLDLMITDLTNKKMRLEEEVGKLRTPAQGVTESLTFMQDFVHIGSEVKSESAHKLQQSEYNLAQTKQALQLAKEDERNIMLQHTKFKEKFIEEKHKLQVKLELLKKELADCRPTANKNESEATVLEREKKLRLKALNAMHTTNSTIKTKADIVLEQVLAISSELHTSKEQNSKLQADMATVIESKKIIQDRNDNLLLENDILLTDNSDLKNQLFRLCKDYHSRSSQTRDISDKLDQSVEELQESLNNSSWNVEDEEVSKLMQNVIANEAVQEEVHKYKEELHKANEVKISLESTIRTLTEEKTYTAVRTQRLEAEIAEMKRLYTPLKQKEEKLKMIEKINDSRETEYQKLARAIGYEPTPTIVIFRELTNFGDHRHHDFVKLIYHQITYWNVIEFEDLPVLQAVVNSYSNLITKFAQDLDVLTHIFSGASQLLYMLYKNRGADLEDIIAVEPLDVKQAVQDEKQKSRSGSFSFNSLSLHNITPAVSLGHNSAYGVEPREPRNGNYPARAPTPDVSNMLQSQLGQSAIYTASPSPSPSPVPGKSGNTSGSFERGSAKLQFRLIRSSGDFFTQLKAIVGKCFGLLLSFVASRLDPLLDQAILVENFNTKKHSELPSLRPVISFLHKTLSVFQVNLVHLSLSQQFFSEVFNRINNILMNGVLLRQQFCTETFGSYLKTRIESIQATADEMHQMWVGDVTACFQGVKQVAAVLALSNKNSLAEDKIRKATCPALNSLQLRQLLSMFTPGEFGKRVPIPIINAIGARAPHADTDRILLDVNVVRPFPIKVLHYFEVEDILKTATTPTVRSLVDNIIAGKA